MKHKGTIKKSLLALNIIPIIVICFILILVSTDKINSVLQKQVRVNMSNLGETIIRYIDDMYEGDYSVERKNNQIILYKGNNNLTDLIGDYVDDISRKSDKEITLFYGEIRAVTTIVDDTGKRFLYTEAPTVVKKDVLENGRENFYTNVKIGNSRYYAYYIPLKNSDNSIAGMIAILDPEKEVKSLIIKAVIPIFLVPIAIMIITIIITCAYSNGLIRDIRNLESYMEEVSKHNFDVELSESVYKRNDELYQIGKSTTEMKNSLRKLIEQDALTGLYNRRFGDMQFQSVWNRNQQYNEQITIIMGDIDYFKKVNDTYGHVAGDMVLKKVSSIIKNKVANNGFVIRWGGEEFLICCYKISPEKVYDIVADIHKEIEHTVIEYENNQIKVTMTFGMALGNTSMQSEEIIKEADDKLYEGKQGGRNTIVVANGIEIGTKM